MHAVAAFFASIITFVSGFFAPTIASNSTVDIQTTQPAAAATAQIEVTGNPFNDPAAASAVAATIPAAPAPSLPASPPQTIINQPVIERIIERVAPQGAANISTEKLAAILADFEQSIESRIAVLIPPKAAIPEQVAAAGSATGAFFPASQRIDQLANTTINSPTISGGTINNATVSGTLSGTFSGTSSFTAATTSSLAISSIPWGLLSTDGSGNIVSTSTPTAAAFIATSTIASQFPYASSTALSVSGTGFFGTATTTSLFAQTANLGSLSLPSLTHTILSTNGAGQVVATTSIGVNYLSGILGIANGGTATGTQVTNGVTYFDGTRITSGTAFTFNGTNLGIGTTSPAVPLDVKNDGASSIAGRLLSANTSATYLSLNNNSPGGHDWWIGSTGSANGMGVGKLAIYDQTAGMPRLLIDGSGNVGIGTTTPNFLLSSIGTGDTRIAVGSSNTQAGAFTGFEITDQTNALKGGLFVENNDKTKVSLWSSVKALTIDSSGNVGIGTTSPAAALHVDGPGGDYRIRISAGSNAVQTEMFADTAYLGGVGSVGTRNNYPFLIRTNDTERIYIGTNGHVGINVSPSSAVQLYVMADSGTDYAIDGRATKTTADSAGVIGLSQNGSNYGFLGLNNNWGVYCVGVQCGGTVAWTNTSDARLKTAIQDIDASSTLAALMRLRPVTYHWKDAAIDAGRGEQLGFIAQEVELLFPDLVTKGASTTITLADGSKETISDPKALDYSGFVVPLVKAVQEIARQVSDLAKRVVTKEIVATDGRFDRLCVGSTCVTEEQFIAMVAAAGQSAVSPSPGAPSGTPQPPIIELNGNATSTIEIGATYSDLGARIVSPVEDTNLGIVTVLDGATTTAISIDTGTPGEHTIIYTITSPTTGLTGSIVRTIIIAPAVQPPEQPANDNPFNTPPANDNVSTSTLLNTEPTAVSL